MSTSVENTVSEKILLAAWQLEQEGQSPFSAEALIVTSWAKFPRTFGLKGYADQYPDSNKVLSSIMGRKGLANKGWLAKMGQKLYSLSREGKQMVRHLLEVGEPVASEKSSKMSREQERFLLGLLDYPAVQKYQANRKQEMTFSDALRFWGIPEGSHGDVVDARRDRMRAELADISRLVGRDGLDLSNGRHIVPEEISLLADLHHYLEDRFSRHLNLLRSRSGKS